MTTCMVEVQVKKIIIKIEEKWEGVGREGGKEGKKGERKSRQTGNQS